MRILLPLSWQVVGYLLLAGLAGAFLFFAVADYARVETVPGAIALDRGVAQIVPTRPGIVRKLAVRESQRVRAGAPLAEIRSEEALSSGSSAPERVLETMEQEEASLGEQAAELAAAASAERAKLRAQISGLRAQVESLDEQIAVQRELVQTASREVDLIQQIASRGYVSRRDVLARQETLMTRRQQLSQLQQSRSAKQSSLAEAQRSIDEADARGGVQSASLAATRSGLARRRVDAQASLGYLLTAPIEGTVTAVTARTGQAVTPQNPLMAIVPERASLLAELYVPTRAAGFLAPGQEVRLAVDAFPFQRFGTVSARISTISATTVARQDEQGRTEPVYLVTASIDAPWMTAFGRRHRLAPGMTLSARIVTEKRSLLEWLFEPIFAVRRR